jgi:hypothetical protein
MPKGRCKVNSVHTSASSSELDMHTSSFRPVLVSSIAGRFRTWESFFTKLCARPRSPSLVKALQRLNSATLRGQSDAGDHRPVLLHWVLRQDLVGKDLQERLGAGPDTGAFTHPKSCEKCL